jgi:thymidylate kinase
MFITLCGIDGAGKTTLGWMLKTELERVFPGRDGARSRIAFTKLVGDDSDVVRYYKMLVEIDPLFDGRAQNYFFAFERLRTAKTILPALHLKNDVVIVDRYVYCDIAYSRARGRDESMYHTLLQHVPIPDVGFVIDAPAELAVSRVMARKQVWAFQENIDLLRLARESYLEVACEFGQIVVDGSGDPAAAVRCMAEAIMGVVSRRGDAATRHIPRSEIRA